MILLRRSHCLLLLAALVLLLAHPPGFASERAAKEAELKQLRARISELQQRLNQVRSRHDALREELRDSERRIGRLNGKIRELDRELGVRNRRLDALRGEERSLKQNVAEQRDYLAGQVRAAYAMGRQEYLKILLNQESPATVGRVMTYYDYLNRARSERIARLGKTINELERVRSEVETQTRRLRELRARRAEEKAALEKSREQRGRILAKLKREIRSHDQRLNGMLQDERQLKALIRALADALADIPEEPGNRKPFATLKGKLKWPASGPLLNTYGTPRSLGKLSWQGVMIGAEQGQEVRAVSHGRVAFADWLRGYGLMLIIDHGDGYMSLYGHNQSLYKETGDWVETGEVIASVGDSGGADRTALYFEIRKDGKPADPVRWCRR